MRVALVDGALEVTVEDDGATTTPDPGGGYGLTGLGERVAEAGGAFAAGPRDGGGFALAARLPLTAGSGVPE
nr:hypothetical protein [Agromyces mangrovi]